MTLLVEKMLTVYKNLSLKEVVKTDPCECSSSAKQ